MMRCSIARARERAGDGWVCLIVREALGGCSKFGEFEKVPGIVPGVPTLRLAGKA